ncbi:hypothetical protein KCP78_14715 [Salmonella enterica subsp. enterica]|nr:hypothetical protein KCP78_14715 [Salmonella enterica subsp. enterica]
MEAIHGGYAFLPAMNHQIAVLTGAPNRLLGLFPAQITAIASLIEYMSLMAKYKSFHYSLGYKNKALGLINIYVIYVYF